MLCLNSKTNRWIRSADRLKNSVFRSLGLGTEHAGQHGFSLISVLIIMGIVLLAILATSQARVNTQTTQKAVKLKRSYTDINEALVNDVVNAAHLGLSASSPCLLLNSLVANYNAGKVIDSLLPSYAFTSSIVNASTWPKAHQDASSRCSRPRTPGDGSNAADNQIYLCVRLGRDQNAPSDSIMNSELAFAEIAFELIDLQTRQPISCSTYFERKLDPKDGSAGMAVTTALYWQAQSGNRVVYSHKALSYIANQN